MDTSIINQHFGKSFTSKPKVFLNDTEYDYSKGNGEVNIVSWGRAEPIGFYGTMEDIALSESTEITLAEVSIPIYANLITPQFILKCIDDKIKFKFRMTDPIENISVQMNEAYWVPSSHTLSPSTAASWSVRGSRLNYI